jgi:hypothetical protein
MEASRTGGHNEGLEANFFQEIAHELGTVSDGFDSSIRRVKIENHSIGIMKPVRLSEPD